MQFINPKVLAEHNQTRGASISLFEMKPPLEEGCDNYC